MQRIRRRVVLLALWLTILFNIERVDFDQGSTVNLASFVYILAAATAALLLCISGDRLQFYLVTLAMLAVYAVLKAQLSTPIYIGIHKYLTFAESAALLITAGLTWQVSRALQDFEQAVEAISLPAGRPRSLPYEKIEEQLRAEMGRARRHQRPLSVAMIGLAPGNLQAALHQAARDAQAAMIERYVQVRLGMFLTRHIRGTDVIAHHAKSGAFLLLAPETPADQAAGMIDRLGREVRGEMGVNVRYSVADFPTTALTTDELLRQVTDDLQQRPRWTSGDPDIGEPSQTMSVAESEASTATP